MADPSPALGAAALRQMRRLVVALRDAEERGVSHAAVRLAAELGEATGVTIDIDATRELGQPLIVLRPAAPALSGLTPREQEVAQLIAKGLSNKDIADRLCISLATVKDHVHRILDKTGLRSRVAIMAACIMSQQTNDRQPP
jgi:DNA-binding NarL/FixJ family response regulator